MDNQLSILYKYCYHYRYYRCVDEFNTFVKLFWSYGNYKQNLKGLRRSKKLYECNPILTQYDIDELIQYRKDTIKSFITEITEIYLHQIETAFPYIMERHDNYKKHLTDVNKSMEEIVERYKDFCKKIVQDMKHITYERTAVALSVKIHSIC